MDDYQCAGCDAPLDLFELMNWSLDDIGAEHFCEECKPEQREGYGEYHE